MQVIDKHYFFTALQRLSYDLEKVFEVSFMRPLFGKIKTEPLAKVITLLHFDWSQSKMLIAFHKDSLKYDVGVRSANKNSGTFIFVPQAN